MKTRKALVITTMACCVIVLCCIDLYGWLGRNTPLSYLNPPFVNATTRRGPYRFLFCSCQRIVNVTTEKFVFKSLHFVNNGFSSYCHDNNNNNNSFNYNTTNRSVTPSSSSTSQLVFKSQLGELVQAGWDVVVFNVHDMPGPTTLKRVRSKVVPDSQLWAYYNRESPYNSVNLVKKRFDGIFNLTMTPLRQSDVMVKYGYYRKRQTVTDVVIGDSFPLSANRNRSIVWISSHCNLQRDVIVAALIRYVNIDIYGKCARKFKQYQGVNSCARFTPGCEAKLRQYKFGIAFENSLCQDYVTEKYWDAIHRGSIPIVYGGSTYDDRLVIPGSFIDSRSFKSLQELALYLKHVSENENAYMKYHKWRRDYVIDYKPNDRHRFDIVGGKLERLLRRRQTDSGSVKSKVYKLSSFYNRRRLCEVEKRL